MYSYIVNFFTLLSLPIFNDLFFKNRKKLSGFRWINLSILSYSIETSKYINWDLNSFKIEGIDIGYCFLNLFGCGRGEDGDITIIVLHL